MIIFGAVLDGFVTITGDSYFQSYKDVDGVKFVLLLILLSISLLFAISPFFISRPVLKVVGTSMTIVPLFFAFNITLPSNVTLSKSPVEFFKKISNDINDSDTLIVDGSIVRAASWAFKREDIYMLSRNELDYGLGYYDSKYRLIDDRMLKNMIDEHVNWGSGIAIVCKSPCSTKFTSLFPSSRTHINNGYYEFWHVRNTANGK